MICEANRVLGCIERYAYDFHSFETSKHLFITFVRVRPIPEYGCVIWLPYYATHVDRIEDVQRNFLRFISCRFPQCLRGDYI